MSVGVTLAANTALSASNQVDKAIKKYVAKALIVREHDGVMDKLTDVKSLPRNMGDRYYEPYFNALNSAQLTDGIELDSPQHLLDEEITVDPYEFGLQTLITKWSNDIVAENLFGLAGTMMARANEYKRDTTGLTLIDNFTGTTGSGTATLVAGHIAAAGTSLRAGQPLSPATIRTGARSTGDPAPAPFVGVFHEYQIFALAALHSGLYYNTSTQGTTAPTMAFSTSPGSISSYQQKWLEEHYVGPIRGIKVFTDNNLTVSSNAAKGGVFSKEALIHLKFQGINKKDVETDDGRAIKMTLTDRWGWGTRNNAWGWELNCAAVQPTT